MGFLTLIPGVMQFITWAGNIGVKLYGEKLAAAGSHEAKVVELAARELRLDEVEARLNANAKTEIRGRWYAPENLMFYLIVLPYWFKAVTVDNVIGSIFELGLATPILKGDTAKMMALVLAFWFGQRTFNTVAGIIGAAFGRR